MTNLKTLAGLEGYFLLPVMQVDQRHDLYQIQKQRHDPPQSEGSGVLCEMAFGRMQPGSKYNSKTKAFVSTSSMLFVSAGYGGSLHTLWVNGVWGEVKQKWNSPHTHTAASEKKKKMCFSKRGLTEEVNTRPWWSLQSSAPCKHSGAAETSAAPPDACFTAWLLGANDSIMIAELSLFQITGNCT